MKLPKLCDSLYYRNGAIFPTHCREQALDLLPTLTVAVEASNTQAIEALETILKEMKGMFNQDTTEEAKALYSSSRKCHYTYNPKYKKQK